MLTGHMQYMYIYNARSQLTVIFCEFRRVINFLRLLRRRGYTRDVTLVCRPMPCIIRSPIPNNNNNNNNIKSGDRRL